MLQAFNPHRLGAAPQQVQVGFDDIQKLTQGVSTGIDKFATGLNEIGKGNRSEKVTNAIAKGDFDKLNSQESRKKMLELSGGSINADTSTIMEGLIGRKEGAEKASALAASQLGLENLKQSGALSLENVKQAGSLNLESLKGKNVLNNTSLSKALDSQNKIKELLLGNKISQQQASITNANNFKKLLLEQEFESAQNDLDRKSSEKIATTGKGDKESTFDKRISTKIADDVINSKNYTEETADKVIEMFDADNSVWDSEFNSEKDKVLVRNAIRSALSTNDGRIKLALKDKASIYDAVKTELAKTGMTLDEDWMGDISVIKKKK